MKEFDAQDDFIKKISANFEECNLNAQMFDSFNSLGSPKPVEHNVN